MNRILKTENSAEDAAKYDNTDLFDVYRISDFPEVKSLLQDIHDELQSEGLIPRYAKNASRFRDNVRLTILNLCAVYLNDPDKYVAYHRNERRYKKGTRLHKFRISYHYLIEVIIDGFLKPKGYIEDKKGHRFSDSQKISRMRPTKRFVERFIESNKVTLPMITFDDRRELIVLRNEKKEDIPYEDNAFTRKARENLELINQVIDQNVILLALSNQDLNLMNKMLRDSKNKVRRLGGSVDFTRTRLRRIFSRSSWEQGGRYYSAWWHRVPNRKIKLRRHLTINGITTVEPDFDGLHINMLYAKEGIPMPEGDVYHLEGYSNDDTFRQFVKRMLLVMVNATREHDVRSALHEAVHEKGDLEVPEEVGSTSSMDIDPIRHAFAKKHEPIAHYLASDVGIDLQYWDSVLAEYIMVHFAQQGIPCLPVHDSYIIDFRYEDELIQVMKEGFKALFKQECGLKVKHSTGVYDLEWTFVHYLKWMDGKYTDEDAERDEMWLNTHFSRYNQLLGQFADAKGVELEQPVLREIPQEVLNQMRNMVDSYKAKRGKPVKKDTPRTLLSDHIDNPHKIKMVTPTAMKQFKLLRERAFQPKQTKPQLL
ncbi:MAG: hypothetical protein HF981_07300 [Desulfobacteraceae bacterium]|nr:hypothetical protein [Desulfobacteraceae bacterium]MBC2750174.1 hypothetical protein [Desulfobacteraceae bacterium]